MPAKTRSAAVARLCARRCRSSTSSCAWRSRRRAPLRAFRRAAPRTRRAHEAPLQLLELEHQPTELLVARFGVVANDSALVTLWPSNLNCTPNSARPSPEPSSFWRPSSTARARFCCRTRCLVPSRILVRTVDLRWAGWRWFRSAASGPRARRRALCAAAQARWSAGLGGRIDDHVEPVEQRLKRILGQKEIDAGAADLAEARLHCFSSTTTRASSTERTSFSVISAPRWRLRSERPVR